MKQLLFVAACLVFSGATVAYQPAGYAQAAYPFAVPPGFRPPPPRFLAPPVVPVRPYPYAYPGHVPWRQPAPVPARLASPAKASPATEPVPKTVPRPELEENPANVQLDPPLEVQAVSPAPVDTTDRQRRFLEMLLPIVERENARIRVLRAEVGRMLERLSVDQLSDAERRRLLQLARKYRVNGKVLSDVAAQEDLLSRIDTIPSALALAQAANESAWGGSRFAREGNNLFGIWTYDESKGIVPKERAKGAKHLVRKFDSFDESVRYYLHTLNSHPAYQPLRDARAKAREQGVEPAATDLAAGLVRYSAKGERYVALIRELIDRYQLAALATQNRRAG